jgi:GTP-binding protein
MFVDHIRIHAKAGDGGRGCVSFRREKFVPKGGPDGGDGGRGASIILKVDPNVDNLTDFYYSPLLRGKRGEHGLGKNCYGRAAQDAIYRVPVGTIVWRAAVGPADEAAPAPRTDDAFVDLSTLSDEEAEKLEGVAPSVADFNPAELELFADLTQPGEELVLCQGGEGGKGNVHFKSSRNRVPTQYTEGGEGEEGHFYLELRTIADAGLVGYPNAGKSTLLTHISNAHPKIAPYPFTTLTPHIGVVDLDGYRRITVADIPGLIEGAHDNVGLGHDFLRHIVRCKLLVFVLDMAGSEGREPLADLQSLRKELDLYDPTLSERPWVIVANKMDLEGSAEKLKGFKRRYKKVEIFPISADQGEGVEALKQRLGEIIIEGRVAPTK